MNIILALLPLLSLSLITPMNDMKNNDSKPLFPLSSHPAPTGSVTKLFEHGVAGVDQFYNYCPSVFEEDGVRHIYYCANKDAGNVTDYVAYRSATYVENTGWVYSDVSYVLSPSSGEWDSRHVCDPSVVKGTFAYNGNTYSYLMNYLASARDDSMGNGTGFAVSNSPAGPWTKCASINPTIPFDDANDVWGNGQTCMINLDGAGRILYFYSYGGNSGTYEIVREYDLSNLNNIILVRSASLSKNGQITDDIGNNDAEFAYDDINQKLIMVKSKYPYNSDGLTPTFISSELILYVLDLSGNSDPIDELFKGDYQKNWVYLGTINQELSGFPRNHNPGLVTDPYGKVLSDLIIEVNFAVSITDETFWTFLCSYRMYATSFALTYSKFATNRLNRGANVSFTASSNTSDLSTLRIWTGYQTDTSGDGIYIRMRNYTSVETPIDLTFEDYSGYSVKATAGASFKTYSLDGKTITNRSFRSFGSYLMLPAMFDGYVYLPYASLTTSESGTRDLSGLRYIYFAISTYYDSYASFGVGDVFMEFKTLIDVSNLLSGSFNLRFAASSGADNINISRLPSTDFDATSHDLLGGIHVTMNQYTSDISSQWILKSENLDLSGEGLYLRLKNNTANDFWVVLYLLATNNHRMQLNPNSPIYYYDSDANLVNTINARSFGTYFSLPASFDGFMYIPYTSFVDEASWGGNASTSMTYNSVYCLYFGASAYYDYLLDFIVGDVFTTNSYLYDGSLSKYNELSSHCEKVYNGEYTNLSYADGYISEAGVYASTFLSSTYPCESAASGAWSSLNSSYSSLSSEAKLALQTADYSGKNYEDCSEIEKCVWRYDLAVARQGLSDFMSRSGVNPFKQNVNSPITSSPSLIISLFSIFTGLLLGFIYFKRRKFSL